jgi:hypothetical protein
MGWIARQAQLGFWLCRMPAVWGLSRLRDSSKKCVPKSSVIRDLTTKPFGVKIAQVFVRDPAGIADAVEQGGSSSTPRVSNKGWWPLKGWPDGVSCRPHACGRA